ncbi:MAG: hypothetical protein VX589_11085 [Myxococcota bacterium]|nr:hypothetical protein [Myxococcota bacterium]
MRLSALLSCGLILILLPACSLQKLTGDTMIDYGNEHMIPYLIEAGDPAVACATGLTMGGFLNSFERVTDPPDRGAVVTLLSASTCSELRSWQSELASARAIFRGDGPGAVDARIEQKRAHEVTARRLYAAYKRATARFGQPGQTCPTLETEFDQFVWLLGLVAVVQGVQHDRASEGAVGIPLDIPLKAARGSECLNNLTWWGVPNALKAAIWTSVPGSTPKGADPWAMLKAAELVGDQKGVRLARAIRLKALQGGGKATELKAAIAEFGSKNKAFKVSAKWKAMDEMAALMARHLSDLIWTEKTGHRTPFGALGTFPDDGQQDAEGADQEDEGLLDDLGRRVSPMVNGQFAQRG